MHSELSMRLGFSCSDNRKSKTCTEPRRSIRNPKWLGIIALGVTFAMCGVVAQAQQPTLVPRIGYLSARDAASESTRAEAIRQALRELGYIEGQNIAIEYRYAERKADRYPELAAELVRLKVDIILVTGGGRLILAAKNATKAIPIVMVRAVIDPVKAGIVKSLAVPAATSPALQPLA